MHRPETRRPSIPQAARFRGPPRSPVPLSGGGGRSRTPLTSVRRPQAAHPGLRQQRHGGQPGLRRGEGGVLQPGGARVRPRPRQRRHLRLRLQEVGTRGRGWHMRAHTHTAHGDNGCGLAVTPPRDGDTDGDAASFSKGESCVLEYGVWGAVGMGSSLLAVPRGGRGLQIRTRLPQLGSAGARGGGAAGFPCPVMGMQCPMTRGWQVPPAASRLHGARGYGAV